jgi:predicted nucleotidyltransferase
MNKICKIKFGSFLYGTDTFNSDLDIKGIFLPDIKELITQKAISYDIKLTSPNSKNSKEDVDEEYFSIQRFLKLAIEGQTVVLDMLHVNDKNILETSEIFEQLRSLKRKFYTKNLNAFVKYTINQANKYSLKGARLSNIQNAIEILESLDDNVVIGQYKDSFTGEYISKDDKFLSICSKKFEWNLKAKYVKDILYNYYNKYGSRTKEAKDNDNVDFKALSHALRVAYETRSIYINNDIIFPLPEADFIKKVKLGELDYKLVADVLNELIDEIKILSGKSNLPLKCDEDFWDKWLINLYLNNKT